MPPSRVALFWARGNLRWCGSDDTLAAMEDQTIAPDILLEERFPLWLRLGLAGVAAYLLIDGTIGFVHDVTLWNVGKLAAIGLFCGFLIYDTLFDSDLGWIIRTNEIRINKAWINGKRRTEVVRFSEIANVATIRESNGDGPIRFFVQIALASGQELKSPSLASMQRANDVKAELEKRLNGMRTPRSA